MSPRWRRGIKQAAYFVAMTLLVWTACEMKAMREALEPVKEVVRPLPMRPRADSVCTDLTDTCYPLRWADTTGAGR